MSEMNKVEINTSIAELIGRADPRWNQICRLLCEMAPPDEADYAAFFKEVDRQINWIKIDIHEWKLYPLNVEAATEDMLRNVPDKKQRDDLRRLFVARDKWHSEALRTDLYEHGEGVRETEILMLVDEIVETAREKDNFDLDIDVTSFLDERGYVVTERLVDEIVHRARIANGVNNEITKDCE